MLNNASDYKFVNTSNIASMIHGNIMPIVSPNANATAPIYFEDYLFLLEGFYERSNPNLAGNNNIATPPPTIYAANIIATELQVVGPGSQYEAMRIPYIEQTMNYPLYISPNTSIISQPYYIGTSFNTNPTTNGVFSNFTNVKVTNTTAYLPKRPWRGSYVMWSEYIRASYYQMNNCSKLWITPATSCFVSSAKQYTYNYDGSVIAEYDYNINDRANGYQTINGNNGRKSGDIISTYKSNFGTFPYAKSALALVWCSAQESSAGNRQCYCIPIQMTISNGEIQVPQQLFENATSLTCAQLGKTLSTIYYAAAGPVDVVIDFEFPARLNGISWNWQPTYT